MIARLRTTPAFFLRPLEIARAYRRSDLRPDIVAGITVTIVSLPQAIAFAIIAGLPPAMGLYAAIVISIVAAFWGSSSQMQSTPTTALSLLVLATLSATYTPNTSQYILAAGVLAVLAGMIQLMMGLAHLGILVNFVSDAVIVGFAAGAGILIAVGELRHLFGLTFTSSSVIDTFRQLALHLPQTHFPTLVLGVGILLIMVLFRRFRPHWPAPLISFMVATLILFAFRLDTVGVKVIGALPQSLPPFTPVPIFDLSFVASLAPGALAVAALGLIQASTLARTLATQTGERLDNNQEFVGQGLGNIVTGFFSGYPGGGSISCSVINAEAGARTPVAAALSGVFTLVGMLILAPFSVYLPRVALSGVLIVIGIAMVDRRKIRYHWRSSRSDAAIMLVTLLGTLFLRIDFAVLVGILLSLATYIVKTSTPRVQSVVPDDDFNHLLHQAHKPTCTQLAIFDILGDLYFGAVTYVENALHQQQLRHPAQRFLLLRMRSVQVCDSSGIRMLESVVRAYREHGGDVYFMRVQAPILQLMQRSGFLDYLGADHVLPDDTAVVHLFYKVLDPAICIYECPVRVFKECQNLPRPEHPIALPMDREWRSGQVTEITPEQLWRQLHLKEPPLIVDVREPREYLRSHIAPAQSKPLAALVTSPPDLPRDRSIIFVCRGGRRSGRVAYWFQQQGYTQVAVLSGGMQAWEAAGLLEAVI